MKLEQLEKEEDYDIQLPKGDRSKSILEPMITEQWFVKTETLAKEAIKAVETEEIKFVPKNWEKLILMDVQYSRLVYFKANMVGPQNQLGTMKRIIFM